MWWEIGPGSSRAAARRRTREAGNSSVELQRRVEEPRGVAVLQGGDLSAYLVSLGPEKGVQRRVGHVLDLEVVEVAAHQIRLEVQWPQPKCGDGLEVTPLEVRPGLRCIDRRGVEQQVHAALALCEAGVDREGRRQILHGRLHATVVPIDRNRQPSSEDGLNARESPTHLSEVADAAPAVCAIERGRQRRGRLSSAPQRPHASALTRSPSRSHTLRTTLGPWMRERSPSSSSGSRRRREFLGWHSGCSGMASWSRRTAVSLTCGPRAR